MRSVTKLIAAASSTGDTGMKASIRCPVESGFGRVQTEDALAAKKKLDADCSSTQPVIGSEPAPIPSEAITERSTAAAEPQKSPPYPLEDLPAAEPSDMGQSCRSDAGDTSEGAFDPDYCEGGVAVRPRGRRKLKRREPAPEHPTETPLPAAETPKTPRISGSGDEGSQLGSPWEKVPAASPTHAESAKRSSSDTDGGGVAAAGEGTMERPTSPKAGKQGLSWLLGYSSGSEEGKRGGVEEAGSVAKLHSPMEDFCSVMDGHVATQPLPYPPSHHTGSPQPSVGPG